MDIDLVSRFRLAIAGYFFGDLDVERLVQSQGEGDNES
jgi:hypothetical protein